MRTENSTGKHWRARNFLIIPVSMRPQRQKSRKPYVADVEEKDYSFIENKIKEKNVVFDSELDDNAMVQLDKS